MILFLLTAGMVLAVRLICSAPLGAFPRELLALFLGSFTYGALGSVLHLITSKGLIAGLAVFGGLDFAIGRLPFSMAQIAPSYHVRVLADQMDAFTIPIALDAPDPSVFAAAVTLIACAAAGTAVAAILFARRNLATLC
jgi:hypothetical protein